jgi:NAD kinase
MKEKIIFFGREEDISAVKPFFKDFEITTDISQATKGIVVGGDGCILNESVKYPILHNKLPVIKVHFRLNSRKSLGYTIDVNMNNLNEAITDLKCGLFSTIKSRLLELTINDKTYYALNDFAINAKSNRSILMRTFVESFKYKDNILIPTPKCTGIIVSSAYGSTAWNLAVDGAIILEDNLDLMLLNFRESPLKPSHFVLSDKVSINIEFKEPIDVMVDGKPHQIDESEGRLRIKLSEKYIPMVRTKNTYETITEKLKRLTVFQFEQVK